MSQSPGVSAVVVNFNGGDDILKCVAKLSQLGSLLTELIVVDNASTDGSVGTLKASFPAVNIIETGDNLGPAAARNIGLRNAASHQVLLIDDDVFLETDALRCLLECAQSTGAVVCVPRLILVPEGVIQADGADIHFVGSMSLRNGRRHCHDTDCIRQNIGTFSSSCMLVDRTVLLEARGFDEAFFIYQEDMELGLRLRSFGHVLICEPTAIARHDRGSGTPELSFRDTGNYPRRRAFLTMRNRLRMVLLHYRLRSLILLSPALLLFELASIAFTIRHGFFSAWLEAWQAQWMNRSELRERRRWIQSARQVGDASLLIGGRLPLAPGVAVDGWESRLIIGLSVVMDINWRATRLFL